METHKDRALHASKPEWQTFEEVVAGIQRLFTPDADVARNEILTDRLGHKREFDVVIRGRWSGRPILGVIECKNQKARVGTPEVEAFKEKAEKVHANIRLIISKSGFTEPAIEAAEHYGIGVLSLLQGDSRNVRFSIGSQSFAEIFEWKTIRMVVHLTSKKSFDGNFDPIAVTRGGRRAIDWFRKLLAIEFMHEEKLGWMGIELRFEKSRKFSIGGVNRFVRGIDFYALRTKRVKTKFIKWSGDAFYDWSEKKVIWPDKGALVSDAIDRELSDWEDYDGEILDRGDRTSISLDFRFYGQTDIGPDDDVIDLTAL